MTHELRAQETVPVLAADGRTSLGYCRVSKYSRAPGEPLKEITVTDPQDRTVATILVYKLHSRVRCGSVDVATRRIDTKHAAAVARAALGRQTPRERSLAICQEAERQATDHR